MPRAKLRREPCDCLDCREPAADIQPTTTSAAIARQQPPPKSLLVCLTGALQGPGASSLEEADVPHLDALVAGGWAGLLACRAGGPSLVQQLLGLVCEGQAPPQSLADRFKQLRAVLLTDSSAAACAGQLAGCYAVHQLGHGWQPAAELAARICTLLHVAAPLPPGGSDAAPALAAVLAAAGQLQPRAAAGQEGGPEEEEEQEGDDVVDMVLLALDAANAPVLSSTGKQDSSTHDLPGAGSNAAPSSSMAALEWADDLVQQLNQMPGFRETVLLTLVVGPGQQPCMEQPLLVYNQPLLQPGQRQTDTQAAVGAAGSGAGPQAAAAGTAARAAAAVANCLPVRRPAQSYQFAGLDRIAVAAHHPAIVVHRLPAVIRVDSARKLDLAHICSQGAAGCILAERLLPEVSYKLGRAPKYGA